MTDPVAQPMPEENLQGYIRQWQNRELREYFNDFGVEETWDPDLTTPRGQLAHALKHDDADSYLITLLKCWFFEHIKSQIYRVPYYGMPVTSFQETRKFRPQVHIYFLEDLEDVEPGFAPVAGEISFRLMDYTSESITPTVAETLANRAKVALGAGHAGYIWRKGKDMATYNDWGRGYAMKLLTRSESEAKELIGKVLAIQNDTPDWSKMNYSVNNQPTAAFPAVPGSDYLYGETRRKPRKRPVANCRLQYVLLHIHGVKAPVVLYDRTFTYPTALEKPF